MAESLPASLADRFKNWLKKNWELVSGLSAIETAVDGVTTTISGGSAQNKIVGVDYVVGNSGVDASTETLQTLSYHHHEIHSGRHYFVKSYANASINNVIQFTWQMPNDTRLPHWSWGINPESETLWQIYEGGSITTPLANLITLHNNNRGSANTSDTVMRFEVHGNLANANADVDVSGALLLQDGITGSGRTGGVTSQDDEIILKQNELYIMRATANAAGYINFDMTWYEHAPKN